ncbi:MAG: hypothetical protein AAF517_23800 [Planctomycetota bacterium]
MTGLLGPGKISMQRVSRHRLALGMKQDVPQFPIGDVVLEIIVGSCSEDNNSTIGEELHAHWPADFFPFAE